VGWEKAGQDGPFVKVLVVDDRDNVRTLLMELLRSEGNVVKTAVDPRHALAVLANDAFDLIITTSFVGSLEFDEYHDEDPLGDMVAAARGARVVVVTPMAPAGGGGSGAPQGGPTLAPDDDATAVYVQVRALLSS
jgi:DNA-binding NarL/FixJ family response regulator